MGDTYLRVVFLILSTALMSLSFQNCGAPPLSEEVSSSACPGSSEEEAKEEAEQIQPTFEKARVPLPTELRHLSHGLRYLKSPSHTLYWNEQTVWVYRNGPVLKKISKITKNPGCDQRVQIRQGWAIGAGFRFHFQTEALMAESCLQTENLVGEPDVFSRPEKKEERQNEEAGAVEALCGEFSGGDLESENRGSELGSGNSRYSSGSSRGRSAGEDDPKTVSRTLTGEMRNEERESPSGKELTMADFESGQACKNGEIAYLAEAGKSFSSTCYDRNYVYGASTHRTEVPYYWVRHQCQRGYWTPVQAPRVLGWIDQFKQFQSCLCVRYPSARNGQENATIKEGERMTFDLTEYVTDSESGQKTLPTRQRTLANGLLEMCSYKRTVQVSCVYPSKWQEDGPMREETVRCWTVNPRENQEEN